MKDSIMIWVLVLCTPLPVMATDADSSYKHVFKTTYSNGQSQEGSIAIGRNLNCVRIAQSPDKLDPNTVSSQAHPINDEIIFCQDPQPKMTALNHALRTYGVIDAKTMAAMKQHQEEMMKNLGIEPGSGADKDFAKALGDAMGMMKQKQRESMDTALQDPNMSPEERARLEAYNKEHVPNTSSKNPLEISSKITKTGKRGKAEGISCVWYKQVISGLIEDVSRICAAAWEDIPGGQRTKEVFHGWSDFMESLMKNSPVKNTGFETFKEIDRFPLIRMTEDAEGNVRREERYVGTKTMKVSYVPPQDYVLESADPLQRGRDRRRLDLPKDPQLSPPQEVKNPPSSEASTIPPGECRKVPGKGIVCNTGNEPQAAQEVFSGTDSGDPNEETQQMLDNVKGFLDGMGLGDMLNQGE